MKGHYGKNIQMDEKVISPTAMFKTERLAIIKENL